MISHPGKPVDQSVSVPSAIVALRDAEIGMTIGELADRAGVTAETIRYYEREGVVPAALRRGAGRYRHYDTSDVSRLQFISRARALGFSLDEVRELLVLASTTPDRPCTDVKRIATSHLADVEEKLAQLTALRGELQRTIAACDSIVPLSDCAILSALGAGPQR